MEKFEIIKNAELSDNALQVIIHLKNQHWSYGMDSQKQWINENLRDSDQHCLMYLGKENIRDKNRLIAYLNLVKVNVEINKISYECMGIGNVCVDKQYEHKGYGRKLLQNVNAYLKRNNYVGVLLCKPNVEAFYDKLNWRKLVPESVYIKGDLYNNVVMLYNWSLEVTNIRTLEFDRNF